MESGATIGNPDNIFITSETATETWDGVSSNYTKAALTKMIFNASKYNPIYGISNTVQPPAIALVPQIKY